YGEASNLYSSFPATFRGQQVDNTSIVARITKYGDADLDFTVNVLDFNRLASNYNQSPRSFTQGDFNYDSTVNVLDFNLLASHYNQTLSPGAAPGGGFSGDMIGNNSDSSDWLGGVIG